MTNNQEQYQDDEIDLRELLTTLWGNKLLILVITFIFGIAGIAYAFWAPQVWSAKAVVVEPLPEQLEQLQLRLGNLVALMDIAINDSETTKKNQITNYNRVEFLQSFSKEKLFSDFIQSFDSLDNKYDFLKTKGYVPQVDMKDGSFPHSLEKQAKYISANQKKNQSFATLSFADNNAQEALKLLNEYINFIQNKEVATKNKLFADKIVNQTDTLALAYQVKRAETFKRLQEDITRTEFALRISRIAGIEAPVENLNNQNFFTIDLGAKALNEKLNILKEIKNPVLINPTLADIRLQLDGLQAVPQEKAKFTPYHFLQSPTEPLNRDKPKRPLVVVLVTLVGMIVGVTVALIRASWLRRD